MSAEHVSKTRKVLSAGSLAFVLAACSSESGQADKQPEPDANSTTSDTAAAKTIGYDVSFPQGERKDTLPTGQAFGIVGLNGTLANNFNSYFKEQIEWAKQSTGITDQPPAAIYVHVGNPGSKQASVWPETGQNRYGICEGDDSLACDYAYGSYLAEQDIQFASKYQADQLMTWLDVEPNYSWQKDTKRNVATMEGMTHTFQEHGTEVGIYSSADIWQQLTGDSVTSDSELQGLPNWVLGASNMQEAQANCGRDGWTGRIVLAQIADNVQIDRDIACS